MPSSIGLRADLVGLLYLLSALLNIVLAQNFVPSTSSADFPGCGVGCNVLLQAQNLCVPPNVAVTSQLTYENCFCQSSLLQGLYSSPDAICAAECQIQSDRSLLQTWFRNFCNAVGQGVDPLATTSVAGPTATQSVVVITITSTSTSAGSTNTGSGSATESTSESSQSWIEGHWRWILMLGILIVGLGLLAWLLIWLKRRHRRKVDQRRAALSGFSPPNEKRAGARSATPELWGPHQHMHHTGGYQYQHGQDVLGSGAVGVASERQQRRKSRRHRNRDQHEMAEVAERSSSSKRRSSKGKVRSTQRSIPVENQVGTSERDRSRSQRRMDPDSDLERGEDPEHHRRLREVRGARRTKNIDPH